MNWLKHLFGLGKQTAIDLGHALLNFVKSQPVQDLLHTALGSIASAVVAEVRDELATGTGADKRAAAFARITATAEKNGIAFTEGAVNLLIELAVHNLGAFAPQP